MNSVDRYDAGESAIITGILEKPDPTDLSKRIPIPKTEIGSFSLRLTDARTGEVVNERDDQSILDENGGQVHATSGGFRFDAAPLDATPLDPATGDAVHVADFTCIHAGGVLAFTHRMYITSRMGLCTFEEVGLQRKDIGPAERLFVELMIDAFTVDAEAFTKRVFRKSTEANPTVQVFSPLSDQWSVKLDRWPVDKIVSVKESLSAQTEDEWDDVAPVDPSSYTVVAEGILRMNTRPFLGGAGSLRIAHAGGLYRDVGAVPRNLKLKAMRQVAYWHQRKGALGVSGESIQGHSATFYATGDLLDDVKATLKHYKRKVPSF